MTAELDHGELPPHPGDIAALPAQRRLEREHQVLAQVQDVIVELDRAAELFENTLLGALGPNGAQRLARVRELCGPDFKLLSGDDFTILPFLAVGGDDVPRKGGPGVATADLRWRAIL